MRHLLYALMLILCTNINATPNRINDEQPNDGESLAGYEWIEGEWMKTETNDYGDKYWARVIITPDGYKEATSNWEENPDNILNTESSPIKIEKKVNYILGEEVLSFGSDYFYIDEDNRQIIAILGEFHTIYLDKVDTKPLPYQLVEEKPSFQGGDMNQFSKWVRENLVYPEAAKENNIQGRVTVQFTIGTDGLLTDIKVLRGIDPSLDLEAVRVISQSPEWTPGKQEGRAVPVIYNFPVIFQPR